MIRAQWQRYFAALLILMLAFFLRSYELNKVPPGLNGDELFNAIDALRVGPSWPVYFEGNNGREALFFYLIAGSLRLLGENLLALRLPAVFLGLGSVVLAYAFGRNGFNTRVGLLGAALTAVSLWPVMESRWALRAVSLTFMTALTVTLLCWGLREERRGAWLAGGVALGLTMYTYIPSRLFPAVIAAWLGWVAWRERGVLRRQWRNVVLAGLVALAVFAPYGWYMWRYPEKVNQRIAGLTVALDEARAGNPAALGESVAGVLGMFTVRGDTDWRYHLSGRPVFDWLTGLFFYVGLVVCTWRAFRGRRAATYGLLLLWCGAMLVPNAILEANPSFLRAAGAIVPVYLLAALGVDRVYTVVRRRWPRVVVRPWLLVVVVSLGLGVILVRTWGDYFGRWANHPEVREIYQADLALMGAYLEANPPPADSRVFIGHSRAFDAAPQNLAYFTERPVSWFISTQGFPWGEGAASFGEAPEPWYFVPADEPLPERVVEALSLEDTPLTYPDGAVAAWLYRPEPGGLEWTPQEEAVFDFDGGPRLLGYDRPETLYRGDTLPLVLHWEIPAENVGRPNRFLYLRAEMLDGQGNAWAGESELLGYPQAGWQTGDRFVQVLTLSVPEGMPPGAARLRFALHDAQGREQGGAVVAEEPLLVRSRPLVDYAPAGDELVLDGTLALRQATLSTLIAPGLPLNVALEWVALRAPAVDYRVRLELVRPDNGTPIASQTFAIWPEVYPPTAWRPGEPVSSFHQLEIPPVLPEVESLELWLELLPAAGETAVPITQGSNRLAELTVSRREHNFDVPPISNRVEARFGEAIVLLGYDVESGRARPGGEIVLTLYWQARERPAGHYTVFNHLRGPDGEIWGQFDSPPVGEAWLTGTWLPGEVVVEERVIPIRPDAPVGLYRLYIGLYTADDGRRLAVMVDGERQGEDQLLLLEARLEGE